jgi:DNA repair protein RAD50
VEEKHKMCAINLVMIKSSQADLTKYYQALDRALMRFHEMKMEEINKLIKEYWQVRYRCRKTGVGNP